MDEQEPGQAGDPRLPPPTDRTDQPTAEVQPVPEARPPQQALPPHMPLTIGDIAVYPDRVVTPSGVFRHTGLTWVVRDNTTTAERIPPYAIVLAVVFAVVCLLGLLFLLIKEERIQGYVEVSVQSANGYHVTQIPVANQQQVADIHQQVDHARSIAWNQAT